MFTSDRRSGTRGNWWANQASGHSFGMASPLSLRDSPPGLVARGQVRAGVRAVVLLYDLTPPQTTSRPNSQTAARRLTSLRLAERKDEVSDRQFRLEPDGEAASVRGDPDGGIAAHWPSFGIADGYGHIPGRDLAERYSHRF